MPTPCAPPLTGGMKATSSPSATSALQSLNSWLSAARTALRSASRALCLRRSASYTSATVEPAGSSSVAVSVPACSRSLANSLTRTAIATGTTSIYSPDEYVHLFAGVQRPLHRGASALRASIPERDEDVACIDQALVARRRPARVGQLVKARRHHLDGDPFRPSRFGRHGVHSARAAGDDGCTRRQRVDVVADSRRLGEAPASHNRDLQLAGGRCALADHLDVLLEHRAQLLGLAVVSLRIGPGRPWIQDLGRDVGHLVRDLQTEHPVRVSRYAVQLALDPRPHNRARVCDRHPLPHSVRPAHPACVEHPHVHVVAVDAVDEHVRVPPPRPHEKRRGKTTAENGLPLPNTPLPRPPPGRCPPPEID